MIALVLSGCGDGALSPTDPSALQGGSPPLRPVASMSSANPGGTVTITDGLGVSYTLDPVAGELVSSDNKVLHLDDSLTAILATGLRNILHDDSLSAIVDVECDESPDPDMCAQPMFVRPPASILGAPAGISGSGLLFRAEPMNGMRPSGANLPTSLRGAWPPTGVMWQDCHYEYVE